MQLGGQGAGLEDGRGVGALDQPEGLLDQPLPWHLPSGHPSWGQGAASHPSNQTLPRALLRPQQVWAQHNGNVAGGHFIHLLVFSQLG